MKKCTEKTEFTIHFKEKQRAKKKQADLIVMSVMVLSALVVIVSGINAISEDSGDIFVGASIMFAAALITRAMQWASEGKEE